MPTGHFFLAWPGTRPDILAGQIRSGQAKFSNSPWTGGLVWQVEPVEPKNFWNRSGPAGLRRFLPVYRLKKIPLYPLRFFSKMSFTTFEIYNFFRVKYIMSRFKLFYQNIINKFRPKRKKIMFFKFSGFNR
jgi:hypothetical protein